MILLTVFVVFVITTLFGHVAHWSLHQRWMGKFNHAHMTHHLKLYPVSDFRSDVYRDPGKDNTVYIFAIASIPLLLSPVFLYLFGIVSPFIMVLSIIEMLLIGILHDRIHDSFHINNHWMGKLPGYKEWWKLHYQHHLDMGTNFGIFTFYWDRFFGIFKKNWK